jgi:hypothetical protein
MTAAAAGRRPSTPPAGVTRACRAYAMSSICHNPVLRDSVISCFCHNVDDLPAEWLLLESTEGREHSVRIGTPTELRIEAQVVLQGLAADLNIDAVALGDNELLSQTAVISRHCATATGSPRYSAH